MMLCYMHGEKKDRAKLSAGHGTGQRQGTGGASRAHKVHMWFVHCPQTTTNDVGNLMPDSHTRIPLQV